MQFSDLLISPSLKIREALELLSSTAKQILLVVDSEKRLLGTVTDGDVRRGILNGLYLDEEIRSIMNSKPKSVELGMDRRDILRYLRATNIRHLPILDRDGCLVDVVAMDEILYKPQRDNLVVLMVGGLGTRLRPLTDNCPKPLLKIGKKPILETILDSFIDCGFHRFCLAVNYKAEMIESYFGDGSRFGVEIDYIHEKKRMGTAGALYFLKEPPKEPIIVMNGDLLTKVDFAALVDYHNESEATATMAVREYSYQIPYGVINCDGDRIVSIEEKPEHDCFVNAGIYVLSPEVVARVDKEEFFDMPDLFSQLVEDGSKTVVYPIREYWLDIGRLDDFKKAQEEYYLC